jgi:quercetin dioxygenase-like cupin family protein
MVPEALPRMTKNGLVVDGEGWFVLNARESRWKSEGPLGRYCTFEGKRRFPKLGFNISVLEPGQAYGRYHRENAQEGFLVIEGECLLIVEEQERRLKAWDYFHCPGGTEHIILGDNTFLVQEAEAMPELMPQLQLLIEMLKK